MNIVNPFGINNYMGPDYFCDRHQEISILISALENGINCTLISWRRMGKSGLLKHLGYLYQKNKQNFIYLDIYGTTNLTEFINLFGSKVLDELETKTARTLKSLGTALSSLRPVLSFDEFTGNAQFSIDSGPSQVEYNLNLIFNYLENKNKKIVIAIDEFQEIANYPETNTIALLRTLIQNTSNLQFVFSGSSKHILMDMFNNAKQPFYKSTQMLELKQINEASYTEFIQYHFSNANKQISKDAINQIFEYTRVHTFYVQFLCNRLYQKWKKITVKEVKQTMGEILLEQESVFMNYRNLVPENQFQLLRAIANERGVNKITSSKFIRKHNLTAASSVKAALDGLISKEMIFNDEGTYLVQDVFFSLWLARL